MGCHPLVHRTALLAGLIIAASGTATANSNPGAHQHGHANLQMAIEGHSISLMLMSPAANLIGFEHQPHTDAEKQQLSDLVRWASDTPLINTPEQRCLVTDSQLHTSWPQGGHHDHHQDHEENSHGDIEISQTLDCQGLGNSDQWSTPLMAEFPDIEQLDVQWVSPQGQGGTRLEHPASSFRIEH
ncbi:DUF2796 domain-containing protein [Marinobacter fuscus]|uniref:DUF2796 domain-containing protein n=1 Tax=Marinobacter fuscus TaxID=2109942 RepID=A0A2T1KDY8_9GAMM|nr:DUF2796 domain-containing protein [Marinobacter fuscus]PSF08270.1 DUF2796 domain-containing protein [Marinobacter fuscus]